MRGVVDRFVDNVVVVLIGEDEVEHLVPLRLVPSHIREGDIVDVFIKGNEIVKVESSLQEKEKTKSRIENKMAMLRKKQRSHFKKND